MSATRPSKHQTPVAQLVIIVSLFMLSTFISLASAHADPTTTPGVGAMPGQGVQPTLAVPTDPVTFAAFQCQSALSSFNTSSGDLATQCGGSTKDVVTNCVAKQQSCYGDNSASGDDDDDDDDSSSSNPCDKVINRKCPQMNAGTSGDYKSDKRDANDDLTADQKTLNDTTQQAQQAAQKLAADEQALKTTLAKAGLQLADDLTQIKLQLASDLQTIDVAKAAAVTTARGKLDAIQADQVKMKNAAVAASTAVATAAAAVIGVCRDYAEKAYTADLAALNQKIQQQDSTIMNLGSATVMSPYTNDQVKNRDAAKQKSYSGHYTACMAGIEGGGIDAINQEKSAAKAVLDLQISQQLETSLDNTAKAEATTDLMTATAQLNAQAQLKAAAAQAQTTSKENQYNLLVQTTNLQLSLDQQQGAQQQQMYSQQIGQAQAKLSQDSQDLSQASTKKACFDKYASKFSSTAATTQLANWSKAPGTVNTLLGECGAIPKISGCTLPDSDAQLCSILTSLGTHTTRAAQTPSTPAH